MNFFNIPEVRLPPNARGCVYLTVNVTLYDFAMRKCGPIEPSILLRERTPEEWHSVLYVGSTLRTSRQEIDEYNGSSKRIKIYKEIGHELISYPIRTISFQYIKYSNLIKLEREVIEELHAIEDPVYCNLAIPGIFLDASQAGKIGIAKVNSVKNELGKSKVHYDFCLSMHSKRDLDGKSIVGRKAAKAMNAKLHQKRNDEGKSIHSLKIADNLNRRYKEIKSACDPILKRLGKDYYDYGFKKPRSGPIKGLIERGEEFLAIIQNELQGVNGQMPEASQGENNDCYQERTGTCSSDSRT